MESYPAAETKFEDLPEDVVCRIISCLGMSDAARVSASCSAFLRAWGRYPRLTFDQDTLRLRREQAAAPRQDDVLLLKQQADLARVFVGRVDAIMSRRQSGGSAAALDALVIKFDYLLEHDTPCVDRWVRSALTSATTRRLTLDFQPRGCYSPDKLEYDFDFPCSLLSAGTPAAAALEHLYLRLGSLRTPNPKPALTNLVTLVLSTVRVTGEALGHLLSSCHKLQSIELKGCEGLDYVNVSSLACLRSLLVSSCWSIRNIDISGSTVESLRLDGRHMPASLLSGSSLLRRLALKVTSAMFDLQFLIGPAKSADASRLELLSLAHLMPGLESLSFTLVRNTKIVMTSPHNGDNRFRHLKRVDLQFYMPELHDGRDDFLFLYPFLDAAPTLEVLSLDLMRHARVFYPRKIQQPPGGYFRKHQGLPHHSLKDVDITGFNADLASLELALYIIEKACALRSMMLDTIRSNDDDSDDALIRQAIARYVAPAVPSGRRVLLQVVAKRGRPTRYGQFIGP